jgi:hypothetical protein
MQSYADNYGVALAKQPKLIISTFKRLHGTQATVEFQVAEAILKYIPP